MSIETTRLSNGLTVLTDPMPDVRSVSVGVWLRRGSRHEPAHLGGISHFIEHAVFKGARGRSAKDIAVEIDRLGGNFDAFTMHETTGFSLQVIDNNLPAAFGLLADMMTAPDFDETELRRERAVIIEEMKMVEDTPEDHLSELFQTAFFPDHPLGRPIEGTPETVRCFDQKTVADFHAKNYTPENMVVAAAGNLRHEQLIELAGKYFAGVKNSADATFVETAPESAVPFFVKQKTELEQAHLILATPFVSELSEQRHAGSLLATILGGGTSSRLWQKVREENGLAYNVGASDIGYRDCGMFMIYAGVSPEHFRQTIELSLAEARDIVQNGVTEEELALAKHQAEAAILLSLESTATRAANLARCEITYGRQIAPAETIEKLNRVTAAETLRLAREFFISENLSLGALGDLSGIKIARDMLEV
jgi:predicted Zn-dependent peptidase